MGSTPGGRKFSMRVPKVSPPITLPTAHCLLRADCSLPTAPCLLLLAYCLLTAYSPIPIAYFFTPDFE